MHDGLMAVYAALRYCAEEFIAKCRAIAPAQPDDRMTGRGVRGGAPKNARLKAIFDQLKLDESADQALRYFFINRTNFGSGRVNYDIPSRQCFGSSAGWTIAAIDRLEQAASALQGVRLTCGDYLPLFEEPGDDVLIFADPPYVVNSGLSASSQLYQHSFTKAVTMRSPRPSGIVGIRRRSLTTKTSTGSFAVCSRLRITSLRKWDGVMPALPSIRRG